MCPLRQTLGQKEKTRGVRKFFERMSPDKGTHSDKALSPRTRQVLVLVRSGVWHSLNFNRKARIAWVPGLYGNDLELRTHPNKDILSLGESKCGGRCFPTHGCGPVPLMGPPKDKVLLPNKLLHQCNNLDQMKSNWIRKGQGLMYTSAPRWSSRPPERTSGRKIMKPHVCSLGGNINIL